jgi:uncharacterized protein
MYEDMFRQMKKTLGQIDHCLAAASEYAKTKPFDATILLGLRLAPDQFPLSRQVQIACDTAKLGASRLTGKEAPNQTDTEQSIDELRARVRSVIAYLDGFTGKDFEGTATRVITQPRWEGKTMTGHDYFFEHVVPNFFFHCGHVYALLRHNGVPLGKRDYLGALTQTLPAT